MTDVRALLSAGLLLLASCGGPSTETGQDKSADEGEATQATVQQPVPENLTDDPRNEAVPLEPPAAGATPKPAALTEFPATFQGRWGLVPADCEPGRSDAKGLMEVGPKSLRDYESRGNVTRLLERDGGGVEAVLAFTGEGMEWTSTQAFTLQQGGRALVREERSPPTSLHYTKCPVR